jgi:endonuclease G
MEGRWGDLEEGFSQLLWKRATGKLFVTRSDFLAHAGDMPPAQAMAQSFSLANMVPQAPGHNRGVWAKSVEAVTRKYAARASDDVYVITGPVYIPGIADSPSNGRGQVRVPKYLFKLVYDEQ